MTTIQLDLLTTGDAAFSSCGTYRYELRRVWNDTRGLVCWIMLNPSTADAELDDPTIRRCLRFARSWGYGGIVVHNLFALRATDPAELRRHPDPVGPGNDEWLTRGTSAALTVAAWGTHGALAGRADQVRTMLTRAGVRLHHVGLTRAGAPRHPLYLPATCTPEQLTDDEEVTAA
jgi:hypothetical protein